MTGRWERGALHLGCSRSWGPRAWMRARRHGPPWGPSLGAAPGNRSLPPELGLKPVSAPKLPVWGAGGRAGDSGVAHRPRLRRGSLVTVCGRSCCFSISVSAASRLHLSLRFLFCKMQLVILHGQVGTFALKAGVCERAGAQCTVAAAQTRATAPSLPAAGRWSAAQLPAGATAGAGLRPLPFPLGVARLTDEDTAIAVGMVQPAGGRARFPSSPDPLGSAAGGQGQSSPVAQA